MLKLEKKFQSQKNSQSSVISVQPFEAFIGVIYFRSIVDIDMNLFLCLIDIANSLNFSLPKPFTNLVAAIIYG